MVDLKQFEQLSALAQKFNAQSDTLNDMIDEWNKRLSALSLGQEVWLDSSLKQSGYYDKFDPSRQETERHYDKTLLGYARVDGQWQLAIKELYFSVEHDSFNGSDDLILDADATKITRLLSASRELRIRAMEYLDRLFDALRSELTRGLEAVAKAQKLAELSKP